MFHKWWGLHAGERMSRHSRLLLFLQVVAMTLHGLDLQDHRIPVFKGPFITTWAHQAGCQLMITFSLNFSWICHPVFFQTEDFLRSPSWSPNKLKGFLISISSLFLLPVHTLTFHAPAVWTHIYCTVMTGHWFSGWTLFLHPLTLTKDKARSLDMALIWPLASFLPS